MRPCSLSRRLVAEGVGTALLLAAVVGSGIMGERLSGGNVAIALLANTVATGAALVALIFTFGSISGAHFNPANTFAGIRLADVPPFLVAQAIGAASATILFRWLVPSLRDTADVVVMPPAVSQGSDG